MSWSESTDWQVAELEKQDPIYRPTNFWDPGVRQLSAELVQRGLETFKSWTGARSWFYPIYGNGFSNATIAKTYEVAKKLIPDLREQWLSGALNGSWEARRDFDAARLFWDQKRWPFDLDNHGESQIGKPPQRYRMTGTNEVGWGKPYLNYLLALSALSHHVDAPPKSFIEIGGGFGVLGEIVSQRDPQARYVNLDIPPLLTVSAYYLTNVLGADNVLVPDQAREPGPIEVRRSACLPNWRVMDVVGPFDVFVNTYSFQEMEPNVVEHYIEAIAAKQVRYVLSLNSIAGKPKAAAGGQFGVLDQVTSRRIIEMFEQRGYTLEATYRSPLLISAGELAILQRKS
jgi:putative sugar O-methyltransferase